MKISNLADFKSDTVRRWVESNPSPTLQDTPKSLKTTINNNNNTIDFWTRQKEDMPMLLQQPPSHVILSSHETDQPLDFTMSKCKSSTTQKKQFNNCTTQQRMMLFPSNGPFFNKNNNKSITRTSSPSSSSEEEGVGATDEYRRYMPSSPTPFRTDGKSHTKYLSFFTHPPKAVRNFKQTKLFMSVL